MRANTNCAWSFILCVFALFAAVPRAEAYSMSLGLEGIWMAQTMMAANPPLPMLRNRPGSLQITLQPAFYSGSPGLSDYNASFHDAGGKFRGVGGGACLSYAFNDAWGAYAWALGSSSKGDAVETAKPTCVNCSSYNFPSIRASYEIVSAGVVWQAVGGKPEKFALSMFSGAVVSHTSAFQTMQRTYLGSMLDDFDMAIESTSPGLALGMQAGIPAGKKFEFNPFLLVAKFFTNSCASYTVSRQGVDNGQSSVSDTSCGGVRRLNIGEPPIGGAFGMNLTFLPWNLSVNVTSPFLGEFMAKKVYSEHGTLHLFSLSWHYGS